MEKLGIEPIQLLAQIINFTIMLVILTKFLYKPVLKTLEERKKKIEEGVSNAEEMQKKLEEIEQRKTKVEGKAIEEAKKIIENAKKQAKKVEAEIIKEAEKKAKDIIARNKKELEVEREKMQTELKDQTIVIASAIAEKVLRQALDEENHKNVIDKKIKQLFKLKK